MNHKSRIEQIEKKAGGTSEGVRIVVKWMDSKTGEQIGESKSSKSIAPDYKGKPFVVWSD